jgi:hypothetical protein
MITTSDLAIVGLSTTGTFNLLLYDWLINFIFIFIFLLFGGKWKQLTRARSI